jgi:hypothetical protein
MRNALIAVTVLAALFFIRLRWERLQHSEDTRYLETARMLVHVAWAAREYAETHGLGLPDAFAQMLHDEAHRKTLADFPTQRPMFRNGVPLDAFGTPIRIFQGTDEVLVLWSAGSNGEFQARPGGKHFYDDRLYLISKHGGGEVNLQDIEEAFQNGGRLSQMLKSNPFRDRGRWPGTRPATTTSSP